MKYLIVMMIVIIFITGCIDNGQPPVVQTPTPIPIPTVLETPVPVTTLIEHPYYMNIVVSPPLNITEMIIFDNINDTTNIEHYIKENEEERWKQEHPVRGLERGPCPDLSNNCY